MSMQEYVRPQAAALLRRLKEPRRFIQVVAGPRQVGKTTLVTHVAGTAGVRTSSQAPTSRRSAGPVIDAQWEAARLRLRDSDAQKALLVLDEIQKVPPWSDAVKRLWDADTEARRPLKCAGR